MDENNVFSIVFLCLMLFGPLVAFFLTYGLEPLAEKFVEHVESRINKEKDI